MYPTVPKTLTPTPPHSQPIPHGHYAYAASKLLPTITITEKNRLKWAILDSGASSHFILADAKVINKTNATSPILVTLPNGEHVVSSHTCEVDLPQLPKKAQFAHILPGLANRSLMSVIKLCNAGCKVAISDVSCTITSQGQPPIICQKCTTTGFWMIPINEDALQAPNDDTTETQDSPDDTIAFAAHAHETSTKAELIQYHHQSLFSPPVATITKALKNNQLAGFPGLTQEILRHLPPSTATHKGHMHQNRKGLRSTRATTTEIKDARLELADMNPTQEACATNERNLFCFAALANAKDGVIYTDLPGRFPV